MVGFPDHLGAGRVQFVSRQVTKEKRDTIRVAREKSTVTDDGVEIAFDDARPGSSGDLAPRHNGRQDVVGGGHLAVDRQDAMHPSRLARARAIGEPRPVCSRFRVRSRGRDSSDRYYVTGRRRSLPGRSGSPLSPRRRGSPARSCVLNQPLSSAVSRSWCSEMLSVCETRPRTQTR